jgi:hypothetical protein
MRRTLAAVLFAGALSGCGSDDPSFTNIDATPAAGGGNAGDAGAGQGSGGGSAGAQSGAGNSTGGSGSVAGEPGTTGGAQNEGGDAAGGNASAGMGDMDAGSPGACQESGVMVGMTEAHNAVRDSIEPPNGTPLPPLDWSCDVAAVAQAYADELAATMNCDLVHSGGDYGENLYWSSGFQPTPQDVVDAWASEAPCYSYGVFPDQCSVVPGQCEVCGHYTQMVWRNTEVVGCGMAECGQAQVWVCNYDPPGNYLDQYPY